MNNWAVIGTGGMAGTFVEDARHGKGGRFTAVYSRSMQKAKAFAAEHDIEHSYDDLSALLARDDIDLVYIASPHTSHFEQGMQAMAAGKGVLIEKPVTTNLEDAKRLYEEAEKRSVFCQEAVWTRFNPAYQQILTEARDGRLGDLKHCYASFGFTSPSDPEHRLNNPKLAGGALLDIGLYPLLLPLDLFGTPQSIDGNVAFMSTGVDQSADWVLSYEGGRRATVSYSLACQLPNTATISGDKGWVEVRPPFFAPNTAAWMTDAARPVSNRRYPVIGKGYHYEFTAVNRSFDEGELCCPEHDWAASLELMTLIDRIQSMATNDTPAPRTA